MKEELRKEFLDYMNSYGNDTIEQSDNREFNWWSSKLEAKDKEIAELREYKRLNTIGLSGYTTEELHDQIADLKAKLEETTSALKTLIP